MKHPVHGTFTIERTYDVSVKRVFAAFTDVEVKARWFIGPRDAWTLEHRALDLRVGGEEELVGRLKDGRRTRFVARYHVIEPNERLVYAYDMFHGESHLSVSLASVTFEPSPGGSKMTFTEQAAFLTGEDETASREHGTGAHFDRMRPVVSDASVVVSSRVLPYTRARVYGAFADPEALATWFGPAGFTSTFSRFDLRAGGEWRFVMHGPDGTDHPNLNVFTEVAPNERVVYRHEQVAHAFTLQMTFTDLGERTLLTWVMRFEDAAHASALRAFVEEANEQNFDRLAACLAQGAGR